MVTVCHIHHIVGFSHTVASIIIPVSNFSAKKFAESDRAVVRPPRLGQVFRHADAGGAIGPAAVGAEGHRAAGAGQGARCRLPDDPGENGTDGERHRLRRRVRGPLP